jgi:hypothetical protein
MDENDCEQAVNYNKYDTGKNMKEGEHQANIMESEGREDVEKENVKKENAS